MTPALRSTCDDLRRLLERATPGVWVATGWRVVVGDDGRPVNIATYSPAADTASADANAALIASAISNLPALLSALDEAEKATPAMIEAGNHAIASHRNADGVWEAMIAARQRAGAGETT